MDQINRSSLLPFQRLAENNLKKIEIDSHRTCLLSVREKGQFSIKRYCGKILTQRETHTHRQPKDLRYGKVIPSSSIQHSAGLVGQWNYRITSGNNQAGLRSGKTFQNKIMVNHFQENCIGLSIKSPAVKHKLKGDFTFYPFDTAFQWRGVPLRKGQSPWLPVALRWWVAPSAIFLSAQGAGKSTESTGSKLLQIHKMELIWPTSQIGTRIMVNISILLQWRDFKLQWSVRPQKLGILPSLVGMNQPDLKYSNRYLNPFFPDPV